MINLLRTFYVHITQKPWDSENLAKFFLAHLFMIRF